MSQVQGQIYLAVGTFHFQPEFEIEKIDKVIALKEDDDVIEIGEDHLAQGHDSYATFNPGEEDYEMVEEFFNSTH
jgi:hypothetical protein